MADIRTETVTFLFTDVEGSTRLLRRLGDLTSRASIQLPVGSFPTDIAVGEDAVWVVNRIAATVVRIDPEANTIVATIPIGAHPEGIAVGAGAVWVTVQE